MLPSELKSVFDELYLFASSDFDVKQEMIEKLVYEAKRFSLKRKISQILSLENDADKELKNSLKQINHELTRVEKIILTL